MKLSWKLTVAIFVGICAILFVNAWFRVQREIALFEDEARRDHHVMARALSAAVTEIWRVEGEARALDLLARVNEAESHVAIRFVRPDAAEGDRLAPASEAARGAAGELAIVDRSRSPGRVLTWMPVATGDEPGAIELEESLENERAYVAATIRRFVGYTGMMAVVSGLAAMVLGIVFVGRPVSKIIDQARRVGAGELGVRVHLRQRDELGELAEEMNQMCERLAEATRRIESETAARIATIEQLRHADRLMTIGKLASGIAHELGTPLNVVSGRAKMIASGEVTGAEAAENARIIADQAARITGIVRQLLDFARRRTPRKEPSDLASLAEQAANLLRPLAEKQRVSLRVEGEAQPVEVDAGQIQQALTNLVVNAIQSIRDGGNVTVRTGRAIVRPPADVGARPMECALVEVSDTGSGITVEDRARLFEPFFTTKEVGQGTGLGLSVTWGIVREHGGWIDVESVPGSGSTFRLCLPATPASGVGA